MSSTRFLILVLLTLAAVLTLGVGIVFAIDDATLRLGQVEGAGFRVRDVTAELEITDSALRVRAQVGELALRAGERRLRGLSIECPVLEVSATRIACAHAQIAAELPILGHQRVRAAVEYGRTDGSLRVALQGVRMGSGRADLHLALLGERWSATADLQQVAIDTLLALAREFKLPLPTISGSGAASLKVQANGANADTFSVAGLTLAGNLRELTLNNATGTLASEKLQLSLDAELQNVRGDWRVDARVQSAAGQAYAEPVFLDFGVHAMTASMRGTWAQSGLLQLERFDVNHADVLEAGGTLQYAPDVQQPLRELQLDIRRLQFPGAYDSYLQPFLVNTSFKSVTSSGSLRGVMRLSDGKPQIADVSFDRLSLDDGTRAFAVRELSGDWHWRNDASDANSEPDLTQPSRLQFAGGVLLGLDLGRSEFRFSTGARNVRLLETARIPVLDGSIELESFRVRNIATPQVAFIVDATIHPISVSRLCRAFGWPEFGGQVGGVISKLRLREGVVTLGTTLEARVFDGVVRLSDLRLEDVFGKWPRFYANIGLDNLDLQLMTSAFSFGNITGRLSGAVRDLRLFNWTPVSFDAALYTPPNDRSRHRISQRAVANIGNLGGGGASVTAALSSGFLKFFEDFNYERLGLSCRLTNEVCYMNGVAPAPNNGYYLVKGTGIPRIDVIAGARRVDWPRMVAQLKAATQSGGPTVR